MSIAVGMLLAATMIPATRATTTAAQQKKADHKRKFDAAASTTDPKNLIDKTEFKAYDLSMGRPDQAVTRAIDFGNSDVNYDEYLDWAEAKGHEQMLEHFKEGDTDGNKSLTKAELQAKTAAQNALIVADLNKGFDITDQNKDTKIERTEDTAANMVANEFDDANSITSSDKKLDSKELNKIYPMWEVKKILKAYDADSDGSMDVIEYANHYYSKWYPDDVCTKKQIKAGGPKRVDTCSRRKDTNTLQDCWVVEKNQLTEQDEYKLKNSKCDKSYESCARFGHVTSGGSFYNCVLSSYCGKTFATSGLVWGSQNKEIAGVIDCADGVKKDPNQEKEDKENKKR